MAETVGQHSVAAFTSPVNGTTPIDANTVRGNDNTVRSAYVDHDSDPGIHVQSSTLASRPTAGTAGRKWVTVSSGRYQFWYDDGTRWHEVASDAVNVDCLADANLAKGDVVKITGFNNGQNLPTVNKVTSSTDVAFGIVENTVTSGNLVQIVNTGLIEDVDTNGYAVGTILYPNTSGGWTTTKPTSGNYQPAGFVLRGNTNNGVLYVEFSAPRIVERSDNTASTIVLRDASGNFAAGTITAGAVTSTGLVTFASLKGTGATTVTNILDEDNMASDSATALATQQSIKAYVDAQVATVDTLAEVLANGNTTGANDIIVTAGQKVTTDTIAETTSGSGVTIDSVLLKDDVVNATDIEVDTISANNGTLAVTLGSTGVATIAQQPILSSLTASQAVFTDASKGLVSNAITGTGNVVMSASPTLTGTVTAATINATTLGGTLSTAAQTNITSVGTLTSLAVTGDLTVDTSTLKVDSSNNRVGVVNASPAYPLDVTGPINTATGSAAATYKINGTDVLSATTLGSGVTASSLTSVGTLSSLTVSGDLTVDTNTLYVDAANNRVGVGTATPTDALNVGAFSGNNALTIGAGTTGTSALHFGDGTLADRYRGYVQYVHTTDILEFGTTATTKMTLDASGNLGLGVTPSAWQSAWKVLETQGGFLGGGGTTYIELGQNFFYDGAFKYKANGLASLYEQSAGLHKWYLAPNNTSGAGAALTFTQAMTLDASGNLGVGTASPTTRLDVAQTNAKSATAVWQIQTFDTTSATTGVGGGISFGGYKTSNTAAEVFAAIDGYKENATGGNAAGALRFHTQVSGGTGVAERARITSAGTLNVGTNPDSGTVGAYLVGYNGFAAQISNNLFYNFSGTNATGTRTFYVEGDGDVYNTNGTYGTISDIKHKQDVIDAPSQWDDLKAIRFRKFRMKSDVEANPDAPYLLGVVAQELEQTSPGLIEQHPDFEEQEVTDDDGNVTTERVQVGTTKTVKSSILLMKAAVALQEAMARIEALEARLEALEA